MAFSNGTNYRNRPINFHFHYGWQEDNETNKVASEIVEAPEKHLLSKDELYAAEGGTAGLALQVLVVGVGVGSLFAGSPRLTQLFRTGGFGWRDWFMLGGAAAASNFVGTKASTTFMGNSTAYNNHWMAYYCVKSCNRWEGRKILSNAPFMY